MQIKLVCCFRNVSHRVASVVLALVVSDDAVAGRVRNDVKLFVLLP